MTEDDQKIETVPDFSLGEDFRKRKGGGMTRQEALNIIASLNETLDKMSDEELYAHMMKTSPSFRATIKAFNEFVEAQDC